MGSSLPATCHVPLLPGRGEEEKELPSGKSGGKRSFSSLEVESLKPPDKETQVRENSVLKKHSKLDPVFSALLTRPRWKASVNFLNFNCRLRKEKISTFSQLFQNVFLSIQIKRLFKGPLLSRDGTCSILIIFLPLLLSLCLFPFSFSQQESPGISQLELSSPWQSSLHQPSSPPAAPLSLLEMDLPWVWAAERQVLCLDQTALSC